MPQFTDKEKDAVAEALGHYAKQWWLINAMAEYDEVSTATLRYELDELVDIFEARGGRGVDLAESIDMHRAVIAVRKLREG